MAAASVVDSMAAASADFQSYVFSVRYRYMGSMDNMDSLDYSFWNTLLT